MLNHQIKSLLFIEYQRIIFIQQTLIIPVVLIFVLRHLAQLDLIYKFSFKYLYLSPPFSLLALLIVHFIHIHAMDFHIYITVWNKKCFNPYREKLMKLYPDCWIDNKMKEIIDRIK